MIDPVDKYFEAIGLFLQEWDDNFSDYDFNAYLYDEQENIVYGIMDKFYTRTRQYRNQVPKEIQVKNLPSLRSLENNYMYPDSDCHMSDYLINIYDPLYKIYKKRGEYAI